jgi:hypothetical protein
VPIDTPQLPPEAIDAVRRAVSATGRFPRRPRGELSLTSPHRIFAVSLEGLAGDDRLVDAAEFAGWRALLEEDGRVVAAVEVPTAQRGAAGALVNRGPFAQSTVTALTTAERQELVASERVELRLLRVNALYVVALWLHAAEAAADVFVPLAPAPAPLRAETAYESATFEKEVSELARSVLSTYRAADRPDEAGS